MRGIFTGKGAPGQASIVDITNYHFGPVTGIAKKQGVCRHIVSQAYVHCNGNIKAILTVSNTE